MIRPIAVIDSGCMYVCVGGGKQVVGEDNKWRTHPEEKLGSICFTGRNQQLGVRSEEEAEEWSQC